ncbi:immunity protein Imm33 domain-containing protein [Myxococcus fulvus]|uniref:immunity protein Imm33 domain-containing protein n=1 Tax=Myxococcus fulvus TaxID=33 RepID=UPI003B9A6658
MARTSKSVTVELGHVDLPEGILVILDPGLGRFWRHDEPPTSPRKKDPEAWDLRLVGRDAEAAGKAYDREFDARFLFDRTNPQDAIAHFDDFAKQKGFDARAEVLSERVTHVERARRAVEFGGGLGVVKYNGLWAVAVDGLPKDRGLRVVGVPMPEGEFTGRWRSVDVVVEEGAKGVRSDEVAGVMVEHGQLFFAGLLPLGSFRMWQPADGLADFVFHGRDAAALAKQVGAGDFGEGVFGWKDVPMEAVGEKATPTQERIDQENLAVGVDYRPHCNLEKLNALLRVSPEDAASLELAGARTVGCGNRWGDGVFTVSRHFDAQGRVVLIRVELGTEERQRTMRKLRLLSQSAIVTRTILDGGKPIRFAERMKPHNPRDSGWAFSSGEEPEGSTDDASTLALVSLRELVRRAPALEAILEAPVGALFRLEDGRYVEDEA